MPHLAVFRTYAADGRGGHALAVSNGHPADGFEARRAHERRVGLDLLDIFFFKNHALAGAFAACLLAGGGRPGDDRALAKGVKRRHQDAPKRFAVSNQQCNGHNAPDHSEHGQETARGLTAKGVPGLM